MVLKMNCLKWCCAVAFIFCGLSANAQETIFDRLSKQQAGEGVVTIHQDARLKALVGQLRSSSSNAQKNAQKVQGFRVQVYAGNNSRTARQEANEVAEAVKGEFPDLPVYAFFQPPRWLCRVGDYRSIEEADAAMRRLKATGKFKEVSIVREQINIPLD